MISILKALLRLGLVQPGLLPLVLELKARNKTYLGYGKLLSLVENTLTVRKRRPGPLQLAEFGVGRGGSARLLGWLVNRYGGKLTLYDVFARIPPPTELDGSPAQERYQTILNQEDRDYYGNIPDLLEVVRRELSASCSLEQVEFVQGRYEDTLPRQAVPIPFHLVHIDCDWYESTRCVLSFLEKHMQPGAILQIDDYSNWEGARRAVEEAAWLQPYRRKQVEGALVIDMGSPRL